MRCPRAEARLDNIHGKKRVIRSSDRPTLRWLRIHAFPPNPTRVPLSADLHGAEDPL